MAYKDILVFIDDGKTNLDRIQSAFELAKTHNAKLTGIALASLKPKHARVDDDKAISRMGEKLSEQLVEDFKQSAARAGLTVNTIIIFGSASVSAQKMAHYARNFDLVILTQPNPAQDSYSRMQDFCQQVMMHSGRPILFMPYIGARKIPCEKAIIAWDGTPSVTRSVHDAIPLLASLKQVTILVVESKKQKQTKKDVLVEGLAYHLEHHGIQVDIRLVNPGSNSVPSIIQNQISEYDIDLLVMGSYGTPSLKQKMLGGVSRKLLSSMVVPVIMSH